MKRNYPLIATFIVVWALIFICYGSIIPDIKAENKNKQYQQGYTAGYEQGRSDMVQIYVRKDSLRQAQFMAQMERMATIIRNYNKAMKNISGI